MKVSNWLCVVAAAVLVVGCSQDDRDEIADRSENAWNALKGETSEKTPRVVREQQRKERIRQNNTWTPENRAHHPIEYCQAMLEDLQRYSQQLEARAHEKSCAIAAVKRSQADDDVMAKNLDKFLAEAKKTFKESEAANSWPANIGGYMLSREKSKDKINEAYKKLREIQVKNTSKKNTLVRLEKTLVITQNEQKHIVEIREQVQNTLADLRIKKVIEGDNSIVAALNAIEDHMGALGVDYNDPQIESVVQPDKNADRDELFEKIMAE